MEEVEKSGRAFRRGEKMEEGEKWNPQSEKAKTELTRKWKNNKGRENDDNRKEQKLKPYIRVCVSEGNRKQRRGEEVIQESGKVELCAGVFCEKRRYGKSPEMGRG